MSRGAILAIIFQIRPSTILRHPVNQYVHFLCFNTFNKHISTLLSCNHHPMSSYIWGTWISDFIYKIFIWSSFAKDIFQAGEWDAIQEPRIMDIFSGGYAIIFP